MQSSVVSARDRRMSGCVRIRRSCKSPMANSRAVRAPRQNSPPAADELKALDLKSSKVIDLEMFVPRGEVDPVYLQQIRVIGAAMADAGIRRIGRLTMSLRERMVLEPDSIGPSVAAASATALSAQSASA